MLEQLNDYASLISCLITLLTAVVTIMYVRFTYQTMKSTKESVDIMKQEYNMAKQPCVIANIKKVTSEPALDNGRRQMFVEIDLENVSDAPALSVYVMSSVVLKNIEQTQSKIINMYERSPYYFPYLKSDSSDVAYVHYENKAISSIFKDLEITMDLNTKRLREHPTQSAYYGPTLIIEVIYKNISGQWFKYDLSSRMLWAYDDLTRKLTKHNLNEFTYPPKEIDTSTKFTMLLESQHCMQTNIQAITDEDVTQLLNKFKSND